MQKIKSEIERILLEKDWEIRDYKLEFFNPMQILQDPGTLVSACIDMKTNLITITMHPEIEERLDGLISTKGIKQYFSDALLQLTKSLTLHEWGHWQGCPLESIKAMEMASAASQLVYDYLKNEEIKKKMRETGESCPYIGEIKKELVQMHTFYQTNAFTDLIDNTLRVHDADDKDKEDYVLGQLLFYINEGEKVKNSAPKRCEAQKIVAKQAIKTIRETREEIKSKQAELASIEQKYANLPDDDYTKTNSLYGVKSELEWLKRKEQCNLEYIAELRQKRHNILKGKIGKHATLFLNTAAKLYLDEEKEKQWQQYFEDDFPELEQETLNMLTILTGNGEIAQRIACRTATKADWGKALHEMEYKYEKWPEKNKSVVEILLKYLDPDEQLPGSGLGPFFKGFIDNPEEAEEIIATLAGEGKPLHFADSADVYNAIYKKKAQDIVLEEIDRDRQSGKLKIKDISMKKTVIPSLSGIKWSKTRVKEVNGEPQFEFYKEEVPIEVPGSFPKVSRGLPDILFMVDTSGSMGWAYAEREGTVDASREMQRYDLACTAVHSVVNYLEKSKKAAWMKFGSVTFSSTTKFSGWKDHKDIKEMFETLYDKEDSGTSLDGKVIDEVLESKSDNFWAIMVTDGAIGNEAEALQKVQDMVDQGNYFTLIHIGTENSFCKKIRELYGEDAAVVIDSAEQLAGAALKYTKRRYGAIR